MHDPLVGAVCNPEEVWQMTDELLVAQAEWLPNYATEEIEAARARLAAHERAGTRVALRETEGAARLSTRSVEELAADKLAQETAQNDLIRAKHTRVPQMGRGDSVSRPPVARNVGATRRVARVSRRSGRL